MKVIAFYLPQYHAIPENDAWWGQGFTEWENVRKAKPLFEDHYQPRVPLDQNYYNLLDIKVLAWQIELAKKYGVYGFCFYHYWFKGHKVLEKPVEMFLETDTCVFPFCICWANPSWTKAWVSKSDTIIIRQDYGEYNDWKLHFEYLLPFLKDPRYIKVEGSPLVVIYKPSEIEKLNEMLCCWKTLAKENGIQDIKFAYQAPEVGKKELSCRCLFDYHIEYQPGFTMVHGVNNTRKLMHKVLKQIDGSFLRLFRHSLSEYLALHLRKDTYETLWEKILAHEPQDEKAIPGAFVDWDNTSRRGTKGRVVIGATPEKFYQYFICLIDVARLKYKKDMIFITAWNEWSEGAYLEPDEKYKTHYLEALQRALVDSSRSSLSG
jgi:lipopolysaccharide biosynthesis protein